MRPRPRALIALCDLLVRPSPATGAARLARCQTYGAARFHLLPSAGRLNDAADAHQKAVALARDPAMVAFLNARLRRPD